ncbi:MAG: P-loop NTPase fold protein, partial [Anaerolineales bacterium]
MTPGNESVARIARRVAAVTGLALLDSAARFVSAGAVSLENIQKQLEQVQAHEAMRLQWVDEIDQARTDFQKAVQAACEADHCQRLVFMVDNLDRCFPDKVVALCESIKNIFSASEQCVWVLAVDSDVVASYINQKYSGTAMDGYSYLDKIVPEQIHLPSPLVEGDTYSVRSFLAHYLTAEQLARLPLHKGVLFQLPRVLVPRRLIKVARKYSELTEPGPYAFELVLLYYCWPGFYRWLSIDDSEYIAAILVNFVDQRRREMFEGHGVNMVKIPTSFADDRELIIFI